MQLDNWHYRALQITVPSISISHSNEIQPLKTGSPTALVWRIRIRSQNVDQKKGPRSGSTGCCFVNISDIFAVCGMWNTANNKSRLMAPVDQRNALVYWIFIHSISNSQTEYLLNAALICRTSPPEDVPLLKSADCKKLISFRFSHKWKQSYWEILNTDAETRNPRLWRDTLSSIMVNMVDSD